MYFVSRQSNSLRYELEDHAGLCTLLEHATPSRHHGSGMYPVPPRDTRHSHGPRTEAYRPATTPEVLGMPSKSCVTRETPRLDSVLFALLQSQQFVENGEYTVGRP